MGLKGLGSIAFLAMLGVSFAQDGPNVRPIPGGPLGNRPAMVDTRGQDQLGPFTIQLDPPGPERLFRLESEDGLRERMRQEKRAQPQMERILFPEEVVLTKVPYDPNWRASNWQAIERVVEPAYLVHSRLLYQQLNFERYGWDLGPITPIVSAGSFFAGVFLTPYNLAKDPFRRFDSNAGWSLPGDPVPLMVYPIGVSTTGTIAEAAVIFALIACFP